LFGFSLYFGGWKFTKAVAFPIAFLLFMVPMGFLLDPVTFELRLIVSVVSTLLLNVMGIHAVRTGTSINAIPGDPSGALEVADPCSGIRSLVMLSALAALYGYLTLNKTWKKWLLFVAAVPLAVTSNVVRITAIAMIARIFGTESALHVYHNWSGLMVFGVAVISLVGASILLSTDYRSLLKRWVWEPITPPRPLLRQTPNK
jgi:exosortase